MTTGAPAVPGARALERFLALDGTWRGTSTKGWTEEVTFQTIAGGTAVLETSVQESGQNRMATVFHLDGERLLLTHYCMARNHPRLVATAVEEGGRSITFTYVDATNLASRDKGHMDKAVYRFDGPDSYTTRWTWYQDGAEKWMEEIRMTRVK
jgi:hypothetical protein